MSTKVITTTPHSLCKSDDTDSRHLCDLTAKKVGNYFTNEMREEGVPSAWFAADVHRGTSDLNRSTARGTGYRGRVASYLDSEIKKGSDVWVIDLHSFPNSYKDFGGKELVLLILPSQEKDPRTMDLMSRLNDQKVNWTSFRGESLNDIMTTSAAKGVYTILMEFNESLKDERLQKIMDVIGGWVRNWREQ